MTTTLPGTVGALTASASGGAWAWIALDVTPTGADAGGVYASEIDRRADATSAEAAWLRGQRVGGPGAPIELRYVTDPSTGQLSCSVLGRVTAADLATVSVEATRLSERLRQMPGHAQTSVVADPSVIRSRLVPFQVHPQGLVEIRKRIRFGLPTRPDAGVAYYLAVAPFAGQASSWDPFWRALSAHPAPVMFSVGLEPCTPPPGFGQFLQSVAQRYAHLSRPGRTEAGTFGPGRELAPDPFAIRAAKLYSSAYERYQGHTFRLRMTLASPEPLPDHLPALAAAAACPPADDDLSPTHTVVRPTAQELTTAWRNVTSLDHTRWDDEYQRNLPPVPPQIRDLADVVDAAEAVTSWKLPLAKGIAAREFKVETMYVHHAEGVTVTGDSFTLGDGNTVINRSNVINSLNAVPPTTDPDLKAVLEQLAAVIKTAGNEDATDNYNALTEELAKPEPKKSMLKTFWSGITASLGPITEVVAAGEAIKKLIS